MLTHQKFKMPAGIGSIFELLPQEESLDLPDSKGSKEKPKGTDLKEANPKEQEPPSPAVADGVKKYFLPHSPFQPH